MIRLKHALGALALASLSPSAAFAQQEVLEFAKDGRSVISVSGAGEVSKAPDVAVFVAAGEAIAENSVKMRSVFQTLEELGIAESDIQTSNVGVEPVMEERGRQFSANDTRIPKIIGYRAMNALQIRQRSLDDYGAVLDALIAAGANMVRGPNFGLADDLAERDEARVLAVQDARRKATLYAGAADMKVARILVIDDGSASSYGTPRNQFGFLEAMESTPLAKGEITVSQSVQIIFELESK
ncbi:SIMPL domain-containing protein [Pontixanthobacter gangjinensis]|uniref:DUF541 domain-containing protein n=1 Tax=Pontixanthobacter gangjinensis TaxID=1028742 RepID=A0A6I4SQ73_9SPHN|nr:SIMPL domain-containing protein [Pontixanthobacter gangjinensis]MXO56742.1 DUF541 domain-containing protein [Pontixanthobacter gangjinensis]